MRESQKNLAYVLRPEESLLFCAIYMEQAISPWVMAEHNTSWYNSYYSIWSRNQNFYLLILFIQIVISILWGKKTQI